MADRAADLVGADEAADERAHHRRFLAVAHAEVVAAVVGEGLGRGGLGLLVVVLAVDDRGVPFARVLVDVLPDVQHASASRVHEHAPLPAQVLHLRDGDAEGGQDDDVPGRDRRVAGGRLGRLREQADAHALEPAVHVRVVDDLAGEEDPAVGELLPRLVGVLDRALHPVAEAELAGQLQGHLARPRAIAELAQAVDHRAVVVVREDGPDGRLEAESLLEVRLAHTSIYALSARTPSAPLPGNGGRTRRTRWRAAGRSPPPGR